MGFARDINHIACLHLAHICLICYMHFFMLLVELTDIHIDLPIKYYLYKYILLFVSNHVFCDILLLPTPSDSTPTLSPAELSGDAVHEKWYLREKRRLGIGAGWYGIRGTWVDPAEAVPEIAPMTVGEVNTRVTELAELHEHDTQDLYALLDDAQDSRSRISHRMCEEEACVLRGLGLTSIGLSQATHQQAALEALQETNRRASGPDVETLQNDKQDSRDPYKLMIRSKLFCITSPMEMESHSSLCGEWDEVLEVGCYAWWNCEKMEVHFFNISGCAVLRIKGVKCKKLESRCGPNRSVGERCSAYTELFPELPFDIVPQSLLPMNVAEVLHQSTGSTHDAILREGTRGSSASSNRNVILEGNARKSGDIDTVGKLALMCLYVSRLWVYLSNAVELGSFDVIYRVSGIWFSEKMFTRDAMVRCVETCSDMIPTERCKRLFKIFVWRNEKKVATIFSPRELARSSPPARPVEFAKSSLIPGAATRKLSRHRISISSPVGGAREESLSLRGSTDLFDQLQGSRFMFEDVLRSAHYEFQFCSILGSMTKRPLREVRSESEIECLSKIGPILLRRTNEDPPCCCLCLAGLTIEGPSRMFLREIAKVNDAVLTQKRISSTREGKGRWKAICSGVAEPYDNGLSYAGRALVMTMGLDLPKRILDA
ncbi:hypothetical protein Tco_0450874 [Tanacetum coccineum]